VEMTEAANILNNASARSLILMDEIGRGTSTFDGLSLAWAVAHQLASTIRAFTLFATHYFEVTRLAEQVEGCVNVHLDATEFGDSLVFLHAVMDGPANRSFGLAVAQLAGVPRPVIARARVYLSELEATRAPLPAPGPQGELALFAPPAPTAGAALSERLSNIKPDELSPRQALDLVFELHQLAKSERCN